MPLVIDHGTEIFPPGENYLLVVAEISKELSAIQFFDSEIEFIPADNEKAVHLIDIKITGYESFEKYKENQQNNAKEVKKGLV